MISQIVYQSPDGLKYEEETETKNRCARCEKKNRQCEQHHLATVTACKACKSSRVTCSFVVKRKKQIYNSHRRPRGSVYGTRTNGFEELINGYSLPITQKASGVKATLGHRSDSIFDGSSDQAYRDSMEYEGWDLRPTPTVASQGGGYQSTETSSSPVHSHISQSKLPPITLQPLQINDHIPSDRRSKNLLKCGRCAKKNLECHLPPASKKLAACSACRQSRVRCEKTVVTGPTRKADPLPKGGVLMVFDNSPPEVRGLSEQSSSKLSSNHAMGFGVPSDRSIQMPDEGSEQACSPTATASSLDSGYQSIGGTLIPHNSSREVLTGLTEGARKLRKVYEPLPPTFRKQSTTFEVKRGVVIATNDEGEMWYSEHWQERDPSQLWSSSQESGGLYPLPEGLTNLQFAVDEGGRVHAHHGRGSYFSTLWRDAVLSRALDDIALSDFRHPKSERVTCRAQWSDYSTRIPSTGNSSKSNDPQILDDSIMSAQMYR